MADICEKHGVLKRSCYTCLLENDNNKLQEALHKIHSLTTQTDIPHDYKKQVIEIVNKALNE